MFLEDIPPYQKLRHRFGCLERYTGLGILLNLEYKEFLKDHCQKIHGWLTDTQISTLYCVGHMRTGRYLEIGCWQGKSTSLFLKANRNNFVDCIDTFQGDGSEGHNQLVSENNIKNSFINNMMKFGLLSRINIMEGDSREVYKTMNKDITSYDVIFIDGNHTGEFVDADINNYYPFLKPGGLMMGHDYPNHDYGDKGFEDLKEAVDKNVKNNSRFENFGAGYGLWGAIKK